MTESFFRMFFLANEVLIISLTKQCNAGVIFSRIKINCTGRLAIGKGAKVLVPTTFLLAVRKLLFHYITSHRCSVCITISYLHTKPARRVCTLVFFISHRIRMEPRLEAAVQAYDCISPYSIAAHLV